MSVREEVSRQTGWRHSKVSFCFQVATVSDNHDFNILAFDRV